MTPAQPPSNLPDRILSEAEAAEFLGVSRDTLGRIQELKKYRVSTRRIGRKYSELLAYVNSRAA